MVCWSILQQVDTPDDESISEPMPESSRIIYATVTLILAPEDHPDGRYTRGQAYVIVEHEHDLTHVTQYWNSTFVAIWDDKEIYINGARHPIVGDVPHTFIEVISQPCIKPEQRISSYNDYAMHVENGLLMCEGQWITIPSNHPWSDHAAPDSTETDIVRPA